MARDDEELSPGSTPPQSEHYVVHVEIKHVTFVPITGSDSRYPNRVDAHKRVVTEVVNSTVKADELEKAITKTNLILEASK